MELTRDSQKLITLLYREYLRRRKSGNPKSDARLFGGSPEIHDCLCPDWLFEDVDGTCRELSRAGLLDCLWADNIAYIVQISDAGIIHMESRFKNNLKEVVEFLAKFT